MPSFSKLFKSREPSSKKNIKPQANGYSNPAIPQVSDAWNRTRVDPEEVVELLSGCTRELKSRALDMPFLLLPFRPTSNPSAARSFVRNYFSSGDRAILRGDELTKELRLTEPMVLASVLKWCWSRLPGGVVTWDAYELFKLGEKDSLFARNAFSTFIPMSVDSDARKRIIFDFFDLMAAIAAHGKSNGLGGRKLSRYAGWWAFEHYDTGKGFKDGYRDWANSADAASHLFFAYLRSLSPDPAQGAKGIIGLPISLQQLVQATEYPPEAPTLMFSEAMKVVMIVDIVSPTPYALLRRAKNFEYRDDDRALQQFANYEDPVQALTEECRRVLKCISSTNQSVVSTTKASTSLPDASWSRFEDVGFGATIDESDVEGDGESSILGSTRQIGHLKPQARSHNGDFGRPTTPSWADFLSSGFNDDNGGQASPPILLPPGKTLPPIHATQRGQSSQSHRRTIDSELALEPGELASIDKLHLDDSFWWVWITSLAGEEPTSRKAVFGRCALIETVIKGGKWMVMEEQVKGAAPEPAPGAYIAEKKGFLGFRTKRGRLMGRKSAAKTSKLPIDAFSKAETLGPASRTSITPDQHARIQAAAAELQRQNQERDSPANADRRGRHEETSDKTNSVMTLQPTLMTEASQAMRWANQYDKKDIMARYLGDDMSVTGSTSALPSPSALHGITAKDSSLSLAEPTKGHELPAPPERIPLPTSPLVPSSKEAPPLEHPDPPPPKDVPLPKFRPHFPAKATLASFQHPIHSPQQEVSLPITPTPPPKDNPLPPPRSPPSSNTTAQAPAPTLSAEATQATTAAAREPAARSLPHQQTATTTRSYSPETQPTVERKAMGSSREQMVSDRKHSAGTGMKGIFAGRRTKESAVKPAPSPPNESRQAIAAARTALGAKNRPQLNGVPVHQATTQESLGMPSPAPSGSQPPVTPLSKPTYQPPATPPPSDSVSHVAAARDSDGGSNLRQGSEDESSSPADTHDRDGADREFSTFNQGPLVEQPAFAPSGSPPISEPITPLEEMPRQQVPGASANEVERGEVDKTIPLTREISPVQDRWAQIRKNAAERAARLAEEANAQNAVKADDRETLGEETIESRVARIKARVAELTGNMEGGQR